jgi:chaperonin GroES
MITPVGDKVLILPDPKEEKTAGGIIIPDNAQKKVNRGTVAAVSAAIEWVNEETKLNPGDKVLYAPAAGTPVEINGKEHLLMPETSVWAKI